MKTLQHTKYALFYLSVFFLLLSCEKETPEIVEEQELITTVELQFQASGDPLYHQEKNQPKLLNLK